MGLDMYAWAVSPDEILTDAVEVTIKEEGPRQELHYWRKHHDLHGWMEELYRARGGVEDSFNCIKIKLTALDLDALETAVTARALPPTTGFFFGDAPPDDESVRDDLAFIASARRALADGLVVLYDSWW